MIPHAFSSRDQELLTHIAVLLSRKETRWDELHVLTTSAIGGSFRAPNAGETRPFGLASAELDADEINMTPHLTKYFGVVPASRIDIYAFCNAKVDHVVLAELTLYITNSIPSSFVSFGGDLRRASRIPGVLVSLPYETASGEIAFSSFGNAEFLEQWLQHEEFFMVK